MRFYTGIKQVFISLFLLSAEQASAQISDLESGEGASYYYTDHYEVMIDKPLAVVWPMVLDLGGWMPFTEEFAQSGPVYEGQEINLYGDFHIEIVKIIPGRMLLIVNLPTSQEGEDTQGVAMISVRAEDDRTQVSLFMSRIYYWFAQEPNPMRMQRSTEAFAADRVQTYRNNFLTVLKAKAEAFE